MTNFSAILSFIFLLYLVNIPSIENVDRNNFKTCDQSAFCRRQRKYQSTSSPYEVDLQSLKTVQTGHLQLLLRDTRESHVKFQLDIYTLEHHSLRVKINELKPLRKRFQVEHSLVGEPKLVSVNVTKSDEDYLEGRFGKLARFLLLAKPFRLDLFSDDRLVMSMNSKNLFHFEQYRNKPEATDADNEDGMWEETYKSHQDSKPYGPSSIGVDINFINFENVYGIPEHADAFALKSTQDTDPYRLFNVDVFEYDIQNPMALYGSIPYMLAHSEQATVGFFWLNAAEGWIDVNNDKLNVNNIWLKSMFL